MVLSDPLRIVIEWDANMEALVLIVIIMVFIVIITCELVRIVEFCWVL